MGAVFHAGWGAALAALVGMAHAQPATLTVAITATAPPFAFKDETGVLKGFNVDLVQELCERLQRVCRLEVMRFPEVMPAVSEARADVGVANLLKTPEREKLVRFSRVVWRSTSSLIGRRELGGAPPAQLLASLQTCGIAGTRQWTWLSQHAAQPPTGAAGNAEVLELLTHHQCDLALLPTQQALPFLQSPAGQRFGYVGIPLADHGLGGDVHMVVRPGTDRLLTDIDKALDGLVRDGTHERLSRRYFPFGIL
jgi:ABC-type amino acid transport substrate-binding protein